MPPPPPVGSNVRAIQQQQMDGALADRLTIYRHEWLENGSLGDYGTRHLQDIAAIAAETSHPILIEQGPNAPLNESRREIVATFLADQHIRDADRRVIIGRPAAPGITADDAIEIYESRPQGGAGGSGGASGGSPR